MESMDNFRERFEALEQQTEQLRQQTQTLEAQTHTLARQARWWGGIAWGGAPRPSEPALAVGHSGGSNRTAPGEADWAAGPLFVDN